MIDYRIAAVQVDLYNINSAFGAFRMDFQIISGGFGEFYLLRNGDGVFGASEFSVRSVTSRFYLYKDGYVSVSGYYVDLPAPAPVISVEYGVSQLRYVVTGD